MTGEITPDSTPADLEKVKQAAADTGMQIASLACALHFQWPFSSADPAVRAKAVDLGKKALDASHAVGTDAMLIIPGCVEVIWDPSIPVVGYADAWKRASEGIDRLVPHAEAARVALCCENVWNRFLLSPLEMASFVDQFDSPWVAAYFDVGNCLLNGYPQDWIRVLGKRIRRVHLKDFRKSVGTISGFVDLLAGDVDWPEVIRALNEIGYGGPLTAEMIPPYAHYPEVLIRSTSRAMDAILGRL